MGSQVWLGGGLLCTLGPLGLMPLKVITHVLYWEINLEWRRVTGEGAGLVRMPDEDWWAREDSRCRGHREEGATETTMLWGESGARGAVRLMGMW